MADPEFIVAEVSKNWPGDGSRRPVLLCNLFEQVIETNRRRGYLLYQFSLHRLMATPEQMNETIIAVFRKEGE